ncbi:MAG: DUF2860 domain-containing protein [Desulfobacteraceae bacterium]|nr:DUF2860 domain-containing protein [Desulfobacteraceae bacterium]
MLKQQIIIIAIATSIFSFALFFAHAHAEEASQINENKPKPGFSGTLLLGTQYLGGETFGEDAEYGDSYITSLNTDQDLSEVELFFIAELSYFFALTGTQLGLSGAGDGPTLYVSQYFDRIGNFTAGVGFMEFDAWADPFLTNVHRQKTDKELFIFQLAWQNIMETGIDLSYKQNAIDIDNDISGSRDSRLARDGQIHTFALGNILHWTDPGKKNEFSASLAYEIGDMDGESYSYDGYGATLTHIFKGNSWELETSAALFRRDYDGLHPEFNKTRDENQYSIGTTYTYLNPFGFKNYLVTVFGQYIVNDANIEFYEFEGFGTGIGIGYRF